MKIERAVAEVTEIFRDALAAVDPETLVRDALRPLGDGIAVYDNMYHLKPTGRIVVLGVGKAAVAMARGAEEALGDRISGGIIVTKRGIAITEPPPQRVEVIEASHPVPDASSQAAGEQLLLRTAALGPDDLTLVLVSGGGSALVEVPVDGVELRDVARATSVLLREGADIWLLNAVRRRLSRIKGSGLARAAAPARVVNLIVSDVLGNPLPVIASGLSVAPDAADERLIEELRATSVWTELPAAVRHAIDDWSKAANIAVGNVVQTEILADAGTAATAASAAADRIGYRSLVLGTRFAGEAREFGRFWAQLATHARGGIDAIEPPLCLVGAGEMTVTVRGDGAGGRNTEMALAAALEIEGLDRVAVASLATDGDDGTSGAAGGVVVGSSVQAARSAGIDPRDLLRRNDSARFLAASGGLLVSGPTGTNVNDLYLVLVR